MTRENIIEALRTSAGEASEKYKVQLRAIFGSIARAEGSETSDIDVLVDFKEGADLFDFVGLSMFLEEKLQRPVDIVPIDTIRNEVRQAILSEAIYI